MALGPFSDFPNAITSAGVLTIGGGNVPLTGGNYWFVNSTTGNSGGPGTIQSPYTKISQAVAVAFANDVIICLPTHAESISSSTALTMSVAGVQVVGWGTGSSRPTITIDTANTATINVSAASVSFTNMIFVANFLSIAACFTVASAKYFKVDQCLIYDTSSVLNFLNIVKTTGGANTADGLTFTNNQVINLGVTSNNTTLLVANTTDSLTLYNSFMKWAVQNDKAIGIIVTTGVLTNLICGYNKSYRPNTTTAGGSLITVTGTTSTGWVFNNYTQTLTTTSDLLFTTTVGLSAFNNFGTGVVGASGFLIPAADS